MDQSNIIYPPGHESAPTESAPDSAPTPTQSVTPEPTAPKQKSGFKKVLLVLLVLVLIGGTGYGVYYWQQQQVKTLNAQVTTLTVQAAGLNRQITVLNAQVKAAKTTNQNVIKFTNLGFQITVPDSIKDLTFTTASKTTSTLSTASLAAKASTCSATAGPLGAFSKVTGTYTPKADGTTTGNGAFVKQFTGYYIVWLTPQTTCSTDPAIQALTNAQIQALQTTFSTATAITN